MKNNDGNINVVTKKQSEQNDKITFNTLRIYLTIYHTYTLLYCKEKIQLMSNDITINVVTKNNSVNKMKNFHLIHLEFTLQHICIQ